MISAGSSADQFKPGATGCCVNFILFRSLWTPTSEDWPMPGLINIKPAAAWQRYVKKRNYKRGGPLPELGQFVHTLSQMINHRLNIHWTD